MKIPFEVRYDPTVGRTLHPAELVPVDTTIWTTEFTVAFPPDRKTLTTTTTTTTTTESNETLAIPTFSSYRRFLEYLHTEYLCETTINQEPTLSQSTATTAQAQAQAHDWACDALMWTYQPGEATSLYVNFDHGALPNDARWDETLENLAGDGGLPEQILTYLVDEQGPLDCGDEPPTPNSTNTNKYSDFCDWEYMEFFAPRNIPAGEELRYTYGPFHNDDEDNDEDDEEDEEEEDDDEEADDEEEEEEENDEDEDDEDEYDYCGEDIACDDDDFDYVYEYEIVTVTD